MPNHARTIPTLLAALTLAGCGPGFQCLELSVERIEAPAQAPRQQPVAVVLRYQAQRPLDTRITTHVDDAARLVTFAATYCRPMPDLNFSMVYPTSQGAALSFTPAAAGTYTLRLRGSVATAVVEVQDPPASAP